MRDSQPCYESADKPRLTLSASNCVSSRKEAVAHLKELALEHAFTLLSAREHINQRLQISMFRRIDILS
jgi:hypothetical protein